MKKCISILFLIMCFNIQAQKKFTKNDWHTIIAQIPIGYAQGIRDEVLYHPNQLFKMHPNLNHNFWDIRVQGNKGFLNTQWDADHVFKSAIISSEVVCLAFKFGEKQTIKKVLLNAVASYLSYKAGFFLAYNATFKNKL